MSDDSKVLGVVLLIRHGDRQGFYQNPDTYTPTDTAITPVGNVEEFQLGQKLRSIYLNEPSPDFIPTINNTIAQGDQLLVRADAGGEGGVIFESSVSLLQGLFPSTTTYRTELANGTVVVGPLGGYQYISIESVEPNNDVSLEGFTSCGPFNDATTAFYNSTEFHQMEAAHQDFLKSVGKYLDGRPVTLANMWNIFDFMNVQDIHSANFSKNLPPTYLEQARYLADWHEYGVFSDSQLGGIKNIAGRTILPSILDGFNNIADPKKPLKFVYEAISYKPFISLFNMTGAVEANPDIAGVVNYAAAVAFEVRQPSSGGEPVLRFKFKNGTKDDEFRTLNWFGTTGDIPLSTFTSKLAAVAINDTASWCDICANTQDRGCAAIAQARIAGADSVHLHQRISPIGAGFLGASLTLSVLVIMFLAVMMMGFLTLRRGRSTKRSHSPGDDGDSCERKV